MQRAVEASCSNNEDSSDAASRARQQSVTSASVPALIGVLRSEDTAVRRREGRGGTDHDSHALVVYGALHAVVRSLLVACVHNWRT